MDTDLKKTPLVSVIMPVYNAEQFLAAAIESILKQTYSSFEFIIVNDGSSDRSKEIILSYSDSRIVFLNQEQNEGVVSAMERGIARAHGKYIIRADADDISLPARIERQVRFMETRPEVGILGTWMRTIPGNHLSKSFTIHEDLRANLLFNTSLPQPTVCIRSTVFRDLHLAYDQAFSGGAEDYDLWVRASEVTKLACLREALVHYRIHTQSLSKRSAVANRHNTSEIRLRQLASLGITPSEKEFALQSSIKCPDNDLVTFLNEQERWLLSIVAANIRSKRYDPDSLWRVLRHRWYVLCDANARGGVAFVIRATKSPFAFGIRDVGFGAYLKFLIKALLRSERASSASS